MKTISFIIPAYNEAANVAELHSQITEVIEEINNYEFEFLFIENGSTDETFDELQKLSEIDKRVKIIKLSRNFGMDGGISVGIDNVNSNAAIIMTSNLQDDPKIIPKFIEKWEEGYDQVYGIVKSRPGKSLLRKFNSKLFYKFVNYFSDINIPANASDYRLVDKKVIEAVRKLTEVNRFYRGFFSWVGFKSIGINFDRQKRHSGKSHAKTSIVLTYAIKLILAFSTKPLRIAIVLTLLTSVTSLFILISQTIRWLTFGVPFDGFGTLTGIILLFMSFIFLILSILGEYIGLTYEESRKRPHYIIEKKHNF